MATKALEESAAIQGPSGFIELGGNMYVVDYGKIYAEDGSQIGFLFEDGYLKNTTGPLGAFEQLRPIEEASGCIFRGIDSRGLELELPGLTMGPSGSFAYNNIPFHVSNGRICTQEHKLAGHIDDKGTLWIRDHAFREPRRLIDESMQLSTTFSGTKSDGTKLQIDFVRQLPGYRKDKTYAENEIIRYFEDFDKVNAAQKKYVMDSLQLWAQSGILQIVRKSEGNAALGNVKHGAAAVTSVRAGMVHLDKEEFEKEVGYFKQWGTFAVVVPNSRSPQYLEVRINLVVAHEYGHQVEFVLSQKTQERIQELYEKRRENSNKLYPPPTNYTGQAELIQKDRVFNRIFISGYARASHHEYWAEAVAAFSTKEGRAALKQLDPAIYDILKAIIVEPQSVLRTVFHDSVMAIQASLRMGGEFHDKILES
jgi:hypothetical protein